jgi:hypothetical protein
LRYKKTLPEKGLIVSSFGIAHGELLAKMKKENKRQLARSRMDFFIKSHIGGKKISD